MGIFDRLKNTHTNEKDHKEKKPSEQSLDELMKELDGSVPKSDEYILARLSSINENSTSNNNSVLQEDPIFLSASEKFRILMAKEANKAGSLEHETKETKAETKTETEKPKGVFATNPNLKTVFKPNRSPKQEPVSDDGKDPR